MPVPMPVPAPAPSSAHLVTAMKSVTLVWLRIAAAFNPN